MKLAFHGAAQMVTGSKHLLTLDNGRKYLLDCGMFQGMGHKTDTLNRHWGFDPAEVDAVILSHAHIDHSGLLPRLVKEGFLGKIYCTPATLELTEVLLQDSAEIQEDDVRYINKRRSAEGLPYIKPLYDKEDAANAMVNFQAVEYGTWKAIDENLQVLFTDAGHIIGSAAVHLKVKEKGKVTALTFSGDVGRYRDVILRSPQEFPQADYIILESTYGNSLHDVQVSTPDLLMGWIERTCIQKKGKLIIPAFSVGRTQELLFALNQLDLERRLPDTEYFVDSPLSVEATEVIKKYPNYFNRQIKHILETDDDPFSFKGLKYIKTVDQSKLLNFRNEPCVIISASGMADAGRVKHHISNTIENSRNTILLTGYCEPHSLGGKLLRGDKEVKIYGVVHEVHATIGSMRSMSAHGDYEDLCQFLACQDPRAVNKLFLVHGEPEVQVQFRERLMKKGYEVEIPAIHSEAHL